MIGVVSFSVVTVSVIAVPVVEGGLTVLVVVTERFNKLLSMIDQK